MVLSAEFGLAHCKKKLMIFLSPPGCHIPTLPGRESARESLVSDIPAGDGKIANLFYSAAWMHWNCIDKIVLGFNSVQ